jgi:hypothetical protein
MTFKCTGKGSLSLRAMRALKGRRMDREVIPVASIREGLEIFAGELEAVIREPQQVTMSTGAWAFLRATRLCSARGAAYLNAACPVVSGAGVWLCDRRSSVVRRPRRRAGEESCGCRL